jgi:hypothetical protein
MVDLQQPVWRAFRMTFLLLALLPLVVRPAVLAAQAAPGQLDGRLGGSYASFVSNYGEPVDNNPSIGEVFQVDGYGLVAAQFSRLARPSDDDAPALLITLRSERDADVPATTPDDADWTIDEATDRLTAFAPADATLTDFAESSDGSLTATCTSEALSAAFGQISEGGCSIRAVQTSEGRVSFITLSLVSSTASEAVATPVSECDGVAEWAQESGERLAGAQDLLDQLAAVDPATPTTEDDLTAMQSNFADLAADQRAAEVPAAAVTANFYLISAFSEYATAVGDALNGISTNDQDLIDNAADGIADANAKVERASTEIEQLVADCGLEIVPEATPVG